MFLRTNLALMATISSDAESGLDYEDQDEIYFNLSHDELVFRL